jgi:hypothetical protein
VGACFGRGRGTKIETKAMRCGACYYSIMLNAHRVTSMADTDIDAVKNRKNAEFIKQYRLKRKLLTSTETELAEKQKKAEYDKKYSMKRKFLMQQQASTSSETKLFQKQKKAKYDKQYRLKRKLLLQQQASKDIYMIRYFHP